MVRWRSPLADVCSVRPEHLSCCSAIDVEGGKRTFDAFWTDGRYADKPDLCGCGFC